MPFWSVDIWNSNTVYHWCHVHVPHSLPWSPKNLIEWIYSSPSGTGETTCHLSQSGRTFDFLIDHWGHSDSSRSRSHHQDYISHRKGSICFGEGCFRVSPQSTKTPREYTNTILTLYKSIVIDQWSLTNWLRPRSQDLLVWLVSAI